MITKVLGPELESLKLLIWYHSNSISEEEVAVLSVFYSRLFSLKYANYNCYVHLLVYLRASPKRILIDSVV